jgi:hypothetical protein
VCVLLFYGRRLCQGTNLPIPYWDKGRQGVSLRFCYLYINGTYYIQLIYRVIDFGAFT